MLDFFVNSPELSLGVTGADDKIIGETAYLLGIQQHDIAGLFIAGGNYSFMRYVYRFQNLSLRQMITD